MPFNESLRRYAKSEEDVLKARLSQIRTITHPAEKGRSVELSVRNYLRSILPSEYGVGTGFIAYHLGECVEERDCSDHELPRYECRYLSENDKVAVSRQLDVIIYDALRVGPIVQLEGCCVYPLEAVYAYIEIKSVIDKRKDRRTHQLPLESILTVSSEIRSKLVRLYHASVPGTYTKTIIVPFPRREVVAVRSYLFALDITSTYGGTDSVLQILEETQSRVGGYLSGAYISGRGYYRSIPRDPGEPANENFMLVADSASALKAFKNELYMSLSRFSRILDRWTPAIDRYYDNSPDPAWIVYLTEHPEAPTKILGFSNPSHW